ncbi:Serine/threonine-protein kinase PAK 6 [Heracleum sosnowskyi]|uniref:Serine/threonine-protein kinase PAK 6 n=1 Tax=Heracleum sosnowskyi TaxID=360622 RepID=A0AAD8ITP3_9APIA|nr:Serine/threonine-protein kinase PAK 6 [Heracleum sosnowskyi]
MQVTNSDKLAPEPPNSPEKHDKDEVADLSPNCESVLDVSGKTLDSEYPESGGDAIESYYVYKNVFNLIPKTVGSLGKLKTLKFFANEINLFPNEFSYLAELESVQVKISSPGLNGLALQKLKALKELELSKVPCSAFPILREIAGLNLLTRLSVCHYSIRYLPPEIGCLNKLEFLDLSFNKMKKLPIEITYLNNLISLKITNNKLIELPSELSSLNRLNDLDLSNNRLTSLGTLDLALMHNLQNLNLQYNKIRDPCQIPMWMCCDMEGNDRDMIPDEFISSSVDMDVLESTVPEIYGSPRKGSSSSHFSGSSSSNRSSAARKSGKGWKRRYSLQQRARQECLNSSKKCKVEDSAEHLTLKVEECLAPDSLKDATSDIEYPDISDKELLSEEPECEKPPIRLEDDDISSQNDCCEESCSFDMSSVEKRLEGKDECVKNGSSLNSLSDVTVVQDEKTVLETSSVNLKSKRHPEKDLDSPKPRKSRRPFDRHLNVCLKYSTESFCSTEDHLADGFYDAGRDRPFMPLSGYDENFHIGTREVILLDRETDEELDAITLCAQALVCQFKQMNCSVKEGEQVAVENLQIASLLALFVSDHFGGSDKNSIIERTRKAVSGSNYAKPFVCTCPTGNGESIRKSMKEGLDYPEDIVIQDLCERSLQSVKTRQNSIIVPIGRLRFGVCRHRSLLLKYLCDRVEPRVPCELVRGYLDFSPHAWNVIITKSGDSYARMIVDACRPHDIRAETDPEYFYRYIPRSRVDGSLIEGNSLGHRISFPSLSSSEEIGKVGSTKIVRSNLGSVEAAAKVRTLETCGASADEIKNFELNCLGEVRILSALESSCIVKLYGHQISSKWTQSSDKRPERHILQSNILMEYMEGGSLNNYLRKLFRDGKTNVQVELALHIARDVAHALLELHSKDIIHRDIKSENILIDLNRKKSDGSPIVKLCDFDRAIPLRSFLHSCCISHNGIPPADICVGTPRWMAPEVFRTMHECRLYGLEVDIWSFGCVLLELLTLQVPYSGLSESEISELLKMGKRPPLTDELEALGSQEDPTMAHSGAELDSSDPDFENLKFLVGLYQQCTEKDPTDRPTAENLYNMLCARTSSMTSSRSSQE